ncbi:hypothetical protein ACQPW3_23535 [Actinosynnema sp. CA-248983]
MTLRLGMALGCAAGFVPAGFLAAGLGTAGFLAAGFFAGGFVTAGFLVAGFLAAGWGLLFAGDFFFAAGLGFGLAGAAREVLWPSFADFGSACAS